MHPARHFFQYVQEGSPIRAELLRYSQMGFSDEFTHVNRLLSTTPVHSVALLTLVKMKTIFNATSLHTDRDSVLRRCSTAQERQMHDTTIKFNTPWFIGHLLAHAAGQEHSFWRQHGKAWILRWIHESFLDIRNELHRPSNRQTPEDMAQHIFQQLLTPKGLSLIHI